jgi:hypothetical protein
MTLTTPRSHAQRVEDTLHRLTNDVDAWIATASPDGLPHLVPLSFLWDGSTLLIATSSKSVTARNLVASGAARVGVGPTRDVVLIEGTAVVVDHLPTEIGDAFAAKTGFDPRTLTAYQYFRITPGRVQAWREENELKGRTLQL